MQESQQSRHWLKHILLDLTGRVVVAFFEMFSLLPFAVLYAFSSVAAVVLHRIVRYRLHIVRRNIEESFPEKTVAEVRSIECDFYRFFCDYAVETLKLLTISRTSMMKHMRMEGVEQMEQSLENNKLVFLYLGHYGNWEWVSSFPQWTTHPDTHSAQIYRPLNNKPFDYLFGLLRTRFGAENISKYDTMRHIVQMKRSGQKTIIGFISDQSPARESVHHWMSFLSHDTAVITGAERMAKKLGAAVYFAEVTRMKRGYYTVRMRPMTDEPSQYADYDLTEQYMHLLEDMIRRDPAIWLWSHKRWKLHKENFE